MKRLAKHLEDIEEGEGTGMSTPSPVVQTSSPDPSSAPDPTWRTATRQHVDRMTASWVSPGGAPSASKNLYA